MALKIKKAPTAKAAEVKKAVSKAVDTQGTIVGEDSMVSKAGQAHTSKEYPDGTMVDTHEQLGEAVTIEAPAYVNVSMGLTRNIGNYESVRIHVGVTLPCAPDAKVVEETYKEAKAWVDTKVSEVNQEVTEELGL